MPREVLVNDYEDDWQRHPDVTVLANGEVLFVWDSYFTSVGRDTPATTYVAGRRFSEEGTALAGEFVIDAIANASSELATVTALEDGGYVVTFQFSDSGAILTSNEEIWGVVYDADGTVRQETFLIAENGGREALSPEVVARGDGGFSVAWHQYDGAQGFDETYIRHYDATGAALGRARNLSVTSDDFDEINPEGVTLADGSILYVWNSEGGMRDFNGRSGNALRGALFDAEGGLVRSDFHLSANYGGVGLSGGGHGYDAAALQDGGFVTVNRIWDHQIDLPDTGENLVMMTRFDASGTALTGPIIVAAASGLIHNAEVVQLNSGVLLVAWSQYAPGSEVGDDVFAQVYTPEGVAITRAFDISGASDFNYADQYIGELAALPGGGFVAALTSYSIDADDDGIAAIFSGGGTNGADRLTVDETGLLTGLQGNDRLSGDRFGNVLDGGRGDDRLVAKGGDDVLSGGGGDDRLLGGKGRDRLDGGAGRDTLKGGGAADSFVFDALSDSRRGSADTILDFRRGQGDRIDLSGLDAVRGVAGDQAFDFIGTAAFGGLAGELRFVARNGDVTLQADTNGNGRADLVVLLLDLGRLEASDFIL